MFIDTEGLRVPLQNEDFTAFNYERARSDLIRELTIRMSHIVVLVIENDMNIRDTIDIMRRYSKTKLVLVCNEVVPFEVIREVVNYSPEIAIYPVLHTEEKCKGLKGALVEILEEIRSLKRMVNVTEVLKTAIEEGVYSRHLSIL